MLEIITLKGIIFYLICVNIISFFAMWIDKIKAKKGSWRIPEKTLFILVFIGGSIGGILGMYAFRHKTKKTRFVIGFPAILVLQIVCAVLLTIKVKL